MKNKDIYIADILESIDKIKSYLNGKEFSEFNNNTLLQDAVVRNLEIIGEASRRLPEDLKERVDLPWDEISGIRNKIVHDYFELDLEIIWRAVTEDILEVQKELAPYKPE